MRYFEGLTNKYWNHSAKGRCENTDDSEGITLESLGGVFIATLFGLALAMVTLVGEVIYYRRKERMQTAADAITLVRPAASASSASGSPQISTLTTAPPPSYNDTEQSHQGRRLSNQLMYGNEFVPAALRRPKKGSPAYGSIFPASDRRGPQIFEK